MRAFATCTRVRVFAFKYLMFALSNPRYLLARGTDTSIVRRLEAAPGSGKTFFAVLLMDALIHADERAGQLRVHWITAPTKQLVSQIANAAAQHIPSAMFAPVGQSPEGEERLWQHQASLCKRAHSMCSAWMLWRKQRLTP